MRGIANFPMTNAFFNDPARDTSSQRAAIARIISGHQPTGWNANADRAPVTSAIRNTMRRG